MSDDTNAPTPAQPVSFAGQTLTNELSDLVPFGNTLYPQNINPQTIAQPWTFIEGAAYTPFTLNRTALSYGYMSYGLVQTAIDAPVDDAFRGGINIECTELDEEDIALLHRKMQECGDMKAIKATAKWARLFGGAGLIVCTDQDPKTEFDAASISEDSPLAFMAADRWELVLQSISINGMQYGQPDLSDVPEERPFNYYGHPIDSSRVIKMLGREAPSFVRQRLQGWGMSELERCMRELNAYIKLNNVIYELVDEAKIDVYKIQQFNDALASAGGTQLIQMRMQLANLIKNYRNAVVMDTNDEYDHKQMTFAGLADILMECRVNLCAAFKIPYNKLFGDSASGFSSGEDAMENYNSLVEGDVRENVLSLVREVVKLRIKQLFGLVEANFTIEFKPLRILNADEEEDVNAKIQKRALDLYDRDLMSGQEAMESLHKDGLINVDSEVLNGTREPAGGLGDDDDESGGEKGGSSKGVKPTKKAKAETKKNSMDAFSSLMHAAEVRRMQKRKAAA